MHGRTRTKSLHLHKAVKGVLLFIGILSLCFGVGIFALRTSKTLLTRQTYVILTNPLVVWSFNQTTNEELRLVIPMQTVITAADGYGAYAVGALLRLGEIDKKGPQLLTRSLEHALGVPIDGSIAVDSSLVQNTMHNERSLRSVLFSWSRLFQVILGKNTSTLPFMVLLRELTNRYFVGTPLIKNIYLEDSAVLVQNEEADGQKRLEFDTARFDQLYTGIYEDLAIRKERIRLGIVNTTKAAGLGASLARLSSHLGANVVSVVGANDTIDTCVVASDEKQKETKTVRFLLSHYACTYQVMSDGGQLDVKFIIGESIARQFKGNTL